jgi:hypothetical protein
MEKSTLEQTDDYAVMLDLGVALGKNQAFGLVAGRCSAAQAAMLVRLRQEKKYLLCAANWREFCTSFLKISGSEADRMIRLWEEFGPEYFEIAQLMRISPNGYRAIAPAVKDGALHHNGEAIEFDAENSRRLAAAVSELRGSKPAKKQKPQLAMHERIAALDRRCSWIIAEFEEISRRESAGENWLQFTGVLTRARTELARIEAENGL